MIVIEAVTTRELRKNFKKYADDIVEYGDTVLVARPENKNVVMIFDECHRSQFGEWHTEIIKA